MRLTTWNVNGIRNPFSYPPWNTTRSYSSMFDILESDIVVMQELKIQRKDLRDDMVLVDGWDCYFSLPKHKKGYSGVGIYTRNATCAPIRAEEGLLGVLPSPSGLPYRELPEEQSIGGYPSALQTAELGVDAAALDAEGRCVVVEFPAFVLFGVYSPANSMGNRDDFRFGFINALDCRIRNLVKEGKNVVLLGDLNVSRHEIDSAPTLEDIRKGLGTREQYLMSPNRRIFNQMLVDGEVLDERDEGREKGVLWDTSRLFHPDRKGMYTCWETKTNARPGNYGARIDFVLVSEKMKDWLKDANIQEGLLGSDHCPVYGDFKDKVAMDGKDVSFLDVMNPPGWFVEGERKVEWKITSTPLFSAKRMPEFDKRRSIKAMFAAPSLKKAQASTQPAASENNAEASAIDAIASAASPVKTDIDTATIVDSSNSKVDTPPPTSIASPVKRKPSAAKEQPVKRQKPEPKSNGTKTQSTKGQQSLKGFFQSKNPPPVQLPTEPAQTLDINGVSSAETTVTETADSEFPRPTTQSEPSQTPSSTQPSTAASQSPSPRQFASQLATAEKTQRTWGALFAKPVAPLCEGHAEPCKSMQTKKKGSNQGRSFWMCARPLGPSGEKEKGTQWRCGTFIWCGDWDARSKEAKDVAAATDTSNGLGGVQKQGESEKAWTEKFENR
ncbi:DNA-(apurinic or apyrimidinic site) endonuclease 2 [Fulvia fulva]|uniref:DNA-(apurinic or apyrimidinic site) endonuclease 2 n=1 Tax=Passalora fulva TaxID=5499 RepID=A0A9Q8PMX7_PASFU|nr:DNA-(apurinic or apyrimidinic site) endonuclease 2 [Fulvia fulva]KAK4609963.1 DNA-(apurinic or apyrimidinic site) endonuclease 2 [Fulvia fulva]UJO25339.1 DNA-(apurinic or apyrimidinic site) endonuclease 2 [Fulvia fulva]WPV22892.1 DNA-(apurinic or apyrimidinic site) endonuclease 2 [Fulvia fulva]